MVPNYRAVRSMLNHAYNDKSNLWLVNSCLTFFRRTCALSTTFLTVCHLAYILWKTNPCTSCPDMERSASLFKKSNSGIRSALPMAIWRFFYVTSVEHPDITSGRLWHATVQVEFVKSQNNPYCDWWISYHSWVWNHGKAPPISCKYRYFTHIQRVQALSPLLNMGYIRRWRNGNPRRDSTSQSHLT